MLPQGCFDDCDQSISKLVIDESDVYDELMSIDIYKSFGPDNVHPKLLKSLADSPSFVKCLTSFYLKCAKEECIDIKYTCILAPFPLLDVLYTILPLKHVVIIGLCIYLLHNTMAL